MWSFPPQTSHPYTPTPSSPGKLWGSVRDVSSGEFSQCPLHYVSVQFSDYWLLRLHPYCSRPTGRFGRQPRRFHQWVIYTIDSRPWNFAVPYCYRALFTLKYLLNIRKFESCICIEASITLELYVPNKLLE